MEPPSETNPLVKGVLLDTLLFKLTSDYDTFELCAAIFLSLALSGASHASLALATPMVKFQGARALLLHSSADST